MTMMKETGQKLQQPKRNQSRLPLAVTFDTSIHVRDALHLNDISPEEHDVYWYSNEEYALIREMIELTLDMFAIGEEENDEIFCYRGLHELSRQGRIRFEHRRSQVLATVFSIQSYQERTTKKRLEHHHVEKLALACELQSFACKQVARAKGRLDELEVQEYLKK